MQPICPSCQHFGGWDADGVWCFAYPNGIPDRIFGTTIDARGMVGHFEHQPGDHGLKYQPRTDSGWDAAYLAEVRAIMQKWHDAHPQHGPQEAV